MVTGVKREGSQLVVTFAADVDRTAVSELIAIEQDCCPFLAFRFDACSSRLEVGVDSSETAPALDAIAAAFAPAQADGHLNESHRVGHRASSSSKARRRA